MAALPWANGGAGTEGPQPAAFEGVEAGCTLEILWNLEADKEDRIAEESSVWWPARVVEVAPHKSGEALKAKYKLRYTAKPEFGFEEVDHWATLLSADQLLQDGEDEAQPWRRQGDRGTPGPVDGNATVTLSQLCAGESDLERGLGTSLETAALSSISNMEPAHQARVAAGYRVFADHIVTALKEHVQQRGCGENAMVTDEDMHNILRSFKG